MERKKKYWKLYDPVKAFTLLEIVFAIGIASILFLLIGSLLKNSLEYSEGFSRQWIKENRLYFATTTVSDEILKADKIQILTNNKIQLTIKEKEKGETPYLHIQYYFEQKSLMRQAYRSNSEEGIHWSSEDIGKNVILSSLDGWRVEKEKDILHISWEYKNSLQEQKVALRGAQ